MLNLFKPKVKLDLDLKNDTEIIKDAMRKIIAGDLDYLVTAEVKDTEFLELYNDTLGKFIVANNTYAMRLNDAVKIVGNASIVEQMLASVETQNTTLEKITESSKDLGESITKISTMMNDVSSYINTGVKVSKESINKMTYSVELVGKSFYEVNNINTMVQSFKESTKKITEIVDIVKSIAEQTNLLSLNAAIEAARVGESGKGFAVVANEVKKLSYMTQKSTEDISEYISHLQKDIDLLTTTVSSTADQIRVGNAAVQESIGGINNIYESYKTIDISITDIKNQVQVQSEETSRLVKNVSDVAIESNILKQCCDGVGDILFKISRAVDTIRGSIARFSSKLTDADWMDVFEADHIIYTWRLFNYIYGYETLNFANINNPNSCKLGKWYNSVTSEAILNNRDFRSVKEKHEELHRLGVLCFEAVTKQNKELALHYFYKMKETLLGLALSIANLKETLDTATTKVNWNI